MRVVRCSILSKKMESSAASGEIWNYVEENILVGRKW